MFALLRDGKTGAFATTVGPDKLLNFTYTFVTFSYLRALCVILKTSPLSTPLPRRPSLALPELFGDLECCQISLVLPAQDQLVMNQARQGRTTCRQHLF